MSKIIGVTVGTPMSPSKIENKLKPVKTVNGNAPDENGDVQLSVEIPEEITALSERTAALEETVKALSEGAGYVAEAIDTINGEVI